MQHQHFKHGWETAAQKKWKRSRMAQVRTLLGIEQREPPPIALPHLEFLNPSRQFAWELRRGEARTETVNHG